MRRTNGPDSGRIAVGVLVLFGLLLVTAFAPVFPASTAAYLAVGGDVREFDDLIARPWNERQFVVESGRLFLLYYRQWHAFVLTTRVDRKEWSQHDLARLRAEHPEIDRPELWK